MQRQSAAHLLETIGAEEAARLLGCNQWTLYRWVREGKVPAIRLGSSVRFRVATLIEWMEQQEKAATR
jgi:excisionase family DNA binding protein